MKITIESTTTIIELIMPNGARVPARIWEGHTESGIPIHCYVTRVAVSASADTSEFERELQEQSAPSPDIREIPLRMIL